MNVNICLNRCGENTLECKSIQPWYINLSLEPSCPNVLSLNIPSILYVLVPDSNLAWEVTSLQSFLSINEGTSRISDYKSLNINWPSGGAEQFKLYEWS